MTSEAELTLQVLECFLKHGPSLSIKDLCTKTKASKNKIEYILSVLEERRYLIETKKDEEYKLTKKIAMLI